MPAMLRTCQKETYLQQAVDVVACQVGSGEEVEASAREAEAVERNQNQGADIPCAEVGRPPLPAAKPENRQNRGTKGDVEVQLHGYHLSSHL